MSSDSYAEPPAVNLVADRSQADYFRDELNRELDALDREAQKLQTQLAEHSRYNRSLDAFRVQGDLRSVAMTRRSVLNMLSALAERFADDTPN